MAQTSKLQKRLHVSWETTQKYALPFGFCISSRLGIYQVGAGLFVFGVDADDVPTLREERADLVTDERWDKVVQAIRKGKFGDAKYFKPLMDNIDDMQVTRPSL